MTLPQFSFRPLVSLVIFAFAWLVLSTAAAQPVAAATVTLNPTSIWAGQVKVGQSVTVSCTLTNHGRATISVSKAVSSNSAYIVSKPAFPFSLAPGRSATIGIAFAPKVAQGIRATLRFYSSGSNQPAYLTLYGRGVGTPVATTGTIGANPTSLSFGSVQAGANKSLSETLTNSGHSPVTISSISSTNSAYTFSGISAPQQLDPAASITFRVVFAPKTSGSVGGSLTVLSNASNRTLSVPLSGNSASAGTLAVSPATANLGSVPVGSSKVMSATLTAASAPITVSTATTTSPEFTLSGMSFPVSIAAGKSVTFSVKFAPTSSGSATGKLTFASNATNSPAVESLTGTGTATAQHSVRLTWQASSSAVQGYNVYRGTVSGGSYAKISSAVDTTTSFSDSGVQAGKTYYYVVTGVSSQGAESGYSNQVTAVVPSP